MYHTNMKNLTPEKIALKLILKFEQCYFTTVTPGNVVRSNQSYANEILTGASGHELLAVHRMSTNR